MKLLETERLLLRAPEPEDAVPLAPMYADPEVMRYLGDGRPLSRADAWRQMAMIIGHWQLRGYGPWAVEERESGRVMGRIGFFNPEGWPGFELGWVLGQAYQGRGYATEGAKAALKYAFEEMNREKVISLIQPANVPSIRVAVRLGERPEGEIELFGKKVLIYGIHEQAWREACGGEQSK